MPGIYTHNYIFRKVVENIAKSKSKSFLNKNIEILFSTNEYFQAGLFGAIGPNIFDYMDIIRKGNIYCNEIAFALHNKNSKTYLQHMINIATSNKDVRSEWSYLQKGYLLGYISHLISDSLIHPYIFFISSFPKTMGKDEIRYHRIRNLRFQYNIDNYFLYRDEAGSVIDSINQMFPLCAIKNKIVVWPAIKYLILESLRRDNESLFKKYFKDIKDKKIDGDIVYVKNFDKIPKMILKCYKIKRTDNPKQINIIDKLCYNKFIYSDFFIRYPVAKRIDEDAMNIHQGRWQYPAFQKGFRYESVPQLVKSSIEHITKIWENFLQAAHDNKPFEIDEILSLNPYTGENDVFFEDMKVKDPIKLKV
ncbi:MAG: zinc dependent phospholipase C family protein [Leptospirales bacterium]|nr:zinc dependent phospholipase C family protein [Leptospirales bacterium]